MRPTFGKQTATPQSQERRWENAEGVEREKRIWGKRGDVCGEKVRPAFVKTVRKEIRSPAKRASGKKRGRRKHARKGKSQDWGRTKTVQKKKKKNFPTRGGSGPRQGKRPLGVNTQTPGGKKKVQKEGEGLGGPPLGERCSKLFTRKNPSGFDGRRRQPAERRKTERQLRNRKRRHHRERCPLTTRLS